MGQALRSSCVRAASDHQAGSKQAMRKWKPTKEKASEDSYAVQIQLFSEPQSRGILGTGRSAMDHKKVKVLVPAFLTCGIFLSTTISKRQKIRFLLLGLAWTAS